MSSTNTSLTLKCCKLPNDNLALTNNVYCNSKDFAILTRTASPAGNFVMIKDFVFNVTKIDTVDVGNIGLNSLQRRFLDFAFDAPVVVATFNPPIETIYLSKVILTTNFLVARKDSVVIDHDGFVEKFQKNFANQVLTVGQKLVAEVQKVNFSFEVRTVEIVDLSVIAKGKDEVEGKKSNRGILHSNTMMIFQKQEGSTLKIEGGEISQNNIFKSGFNFDAMGIGGLDKEFGDIFRRAFASRVFPAKVVKKLGIPHVKGILLYGPPGTGKTLMARQISKMLNGKEPKIVNGPEILNKFVGQSEENIRNLFKDAEQEYKERGDESELHVIIFDEIDAICKSRGTRQDSTGVADTVVNQLLSKIDGVEALNNILVIGMTNRKDLIDEALLRQGRLEVHMEISLPDEKGRLQILHIHTAKMKEGGFLADDVDLIELASETKNFTGAELAGLIRAATSYAFQREIDPKTGAVINKKKAEEMKVKRGDFMHALKEVHPVFAVDEDFTDYMKNGIIKFGPRVDRVIQTGDIVIETVRSSSRTPLLNILLAGPTGCGKTAMSVQLASNSDFPYIKILSPEILVGYSESGKCAKITKIFEDAYKSPISCIVVDDIERIIEYVRLGNRFSNIILQTLLVFMRKQPPKNKKLLILSTTSNMSLLEELDFNTVFDETIALPQIDTKEEFQNVLTSLSVFAKPEQLSEATNFFSGSISIKNLITIIEMARIGTSGTELQRFQYAMKSFKKE